MLRLVRVVGMVPAQRSFAYRHGLAVERLGLGVAACGFEKAREVVEALGVVGMVLAQRFFACRHGLAVERLGLGVAACGAEKAR